MWPRKSKLMFPWIAGALALILAALTACAEVEVVDTTPAASAADTFTSPLGTDQEQHNLAVMAVEFDPPLDYQQLIILRQSIELLVVIENTGALTERDVTVRAQLTTSEDAELLLTRGASVASIAPGEIKLVRFGPLGQIPYHRSYHLEVMVDPVRDETNTGDNRKAFDIQIHPE